MYKEINQGLKDIFITNSDQYFSFSFSCFLSRVTWVAISTTAESLSFVFDMCYSLLSEKTTRVICNKKLLK